MLFSPIVSISIRQLVCTEPHRLSKSKARTGISNSIYFKWCHGAYVNAIGKQWSGKISENDGIAAAVKEVEA
jgi:hypothetical protein